MDVREVELPGIGWKYALTTSEGERITVILHNTGHRELYYFDKGADFPSQAVRMSDEEGRQLGAILSGAYYQPVGEAKLQTVLGELTIDWYTVSEGSPLAGRTIGELQIRARTGASIIAILRGQEAPNVNPGPESRIESGDTLMVIGSRRQVEAFRGSAD